jgi:hypothetical protein
MRKYEVCVYRALIRQEDGSEVDVDIGVVEKGVPFEAYWDSWIDERIYFTMTRADLEALEIGDELAEGDTLVEIDTEYSIWEAEYDEDAYCQSMEVF